MDSPPVAIDIEVKASTDAALLVSDGKTDAWIPVSLIESFDGDYLDYATSIVIPEWLAIEKGLI